MLGALLGIGGGLIKGLFGGKARKREAKNRQKAAQYEVNRKQKGLNRKQYNLAALHKALKREGWYGDDYMKQYGTVGPQQLQDWKYDEVPLEASPGILESLGGGLADAAGDYFSDSAAAGRDARAAVGGVDQLKTRGNMASRVRL